MKVIISLVESKPKRFKTKQPKIRKYNPGFWAGDTYLTERSIRKNKWLSRKERQMLLDMCSGVKVRRYKKVKLSKSARPIARYYIDGILYCDGSTEELSSFWGI